MEYPGFYCTVTGVDGAGKSTLVKHLANYLKGIQVPHVVVREPGGCEPAEEIRQLTKKTQLAPQTDTLLMAAARAELIHDVVKPALARGHVILSDRSVACSCVYQGHLMNQGIKRVWKLNDKFALQGCYPDLEFFLDVSPEIIRLRLELREQSDRFEQLDPAQVRAGYLEFYKLKLYPHVVLRNDEDQREVQAQAVTLLEKELRARGILRP